MLKPTNDQLFNMFVSLVGNKLIKAGVSCDNFGKPGYLCAYWRGRVYNIRIVDATEAKEQ